jgi:indole-3-glycerol phosphate synthase
LARFTQAISEGDGISVIPVLDGDVRTLAAAAELAGAEAIAVATAAEAGGARSAVGLPVLVREPLDDHRHLNELRDAGADAFVLPFDQLSGAGDLLEEIHAEALDLDVDCALGVRDEEELELALERVDPDIVLIARGRDNGDDELERALDLLPDIPAGKLVIVESGAIAHEQVVALQRAGVDAIIVQGLPSGEEFSRAIETLAGAPPSGR